MSYQKTTLSNGLRIVTHPMKERDSVSIGIWIGAGGRYEQDANKGAAHFLEHIVFKGTKNYSCDEIKGLIEGVGGSLNAFTSEEQTCFYAKIPARHLDRTFDILSDMVLQPSISSKDVAKERTVILEEIKMYRDLPQYFVMELLDGLMWPNHPLGKSLAGTPESVSAMSRQTLTDFHKQLYVPGNVVVAAAGSLNHGAIVKSASRKFGRMKPAPAVSFVKADPSQDQPRARFFEKEIEQMHVALGLPGYDEWNKDRYVLTLLSTILGGNMSSRLFNELREKRGWAYSVSSGAKSLHDTGIFLIRAGIDQRHVCEAVELILKELDKIARAGVTRQEFVRGKDYLLGQLLLGLEETMDHMLWIGEDLIAKDEVRTLSNLIQDFQKIRRPDIQRVAKDVIKEERFNLAIVGPLTGGQQTKLKRLLGV